MNLLSDTPSDVEKATPIARKSHKTPVLLSLFSALVFDGISPGKDEILRIFDAVWPNLVDWLFSVVQRFVFVFFIIIILMDTNGHKLIDMFLE